MTRFELETWDAGKLIVNRQFVDLFRQHDWCSFAAIWSRTTDAVIAKKMRTDRITLRFTLNDHGIERTFYIKRHVRSSWKEYVKPLLRLTWPILGARNEWKALLQFHEVGLPTMVPVALGESGPNSFLVTEGLEGCTKLAEFCHPEANSQPISSDLRASLICKIGSIAQTMHRSGLHHQDFYLGHLLSLNTDPEQLFVIDLGRVQKHSKLSRRWIVKDLAQLNYSATATRVERLRFLRAYLGRRLTRADRDLICQIESKTRAIARHSRKNRL